MNTSLNIVIVQLLRFGDLAQTIQAVNGHKKQYPNAKHTLIARSSFGKPLEFLLKQYFDKIYYIDLAELIESSSSLKNIASNLKHLLSEINDDKFDIALNLSFNKSSSYLMSLLNAKVKLGLSRNSHNQISINDRWSQYVFATTMTSNLNPFNLVDIYKNMIGNSAPAVSINNTLRNDTIIVHPFASDPKKHWQQTKWSELIYQLLKGTNATITVVGSKDDIALSEQILSVQVLNQFAGRIQNKVGLISIEETYNDLTTAALFIGHDSMVSHLAAIASTPTITISLGPVRPHETTPYGNFAINIASKASCFPCRPKTNCSLHVCGNDISTQVVYETIQALQSTSNISWDQITAKISDLLLKNITIYSPQYFNNTSMFLQPQSNYIDLPEVFKTMYYYIWSIYFLNRDELITMPKISSENIKLLENYMEGAQYLKEAYRFGIKYSNQIIELAKSNNKKELGQLSVKLDEIDKIASDAKRAYPYLAPIVDYFYVARANVNGNNLLAVAENTLMLYYDASNLSEALIELVSNIVTVKSTRENLDQHN